MLVGKGCGVVCDVLVTVTVCVIIKLLIALLGSLLFSTPVGWFPLIAESTLLIKIIIIIITMLTILITVIATILIVIIIQPHRPLFKLFTLIIQHPLNISNIRHDIRMIITNNVKFLINHEMTRPKLVMNVLIVYL